MASSVTVPDPKLTRETCRRDLVFADRHHEYCGKPAEYIVWGKLFPSEALGPRCADCVAEQLPTVRLDRLDQYAIYRLPAPLSEVPGGEESEAVPVQRVEPRGDRLATFHLECGHAVDRLVADAADEHFGLPTALPCPTCAATLSGGDGEEGEDHTEYQVVVETTAFGRHAFGPYVTPSKALEVAREESEGRAASVRIESRTVTESAWVEVDSAALQDSGEQS
jgi:hypothetical protein